MAAPVLKEAGVLLFATPMGPEARRGAWHNSRNIRRLKNRLGFLPYTDEIQQAGDPGLGSRKSARIKIVPDLCAPVLLHQCAPSGRPGRK
jgi:hypothetical protein